MKKTIRAWIEFGDRKIQKIHLSKKELERAKNYDKENDLRRRYISCNITY